MTVPQHQYIPFASAAAPSIEQVEAVRKVCFFVVHNGSLIFVVRHHKGDDKISVEPPGGKRDKLPCGGLETHEEAIIREGIEELDILAQPEDILHVENHPVTGHPVGYYACTYVDGTPRNAAINEKTGQKEHLGLAIIKCNVIEAFEDLRTIATHIAEEITEQTLPKLGKPYNIEVRIPEYAIMNYLQQIREESGAAFTNNVGNPPNPA